jgi:sensor histidine kinase regulating citrate/malate metabolism
MSEDTRWPADIEAAVTVTDAAGTITAMNAAACRAFASDGGSALVGRSVFDCHPEPALTRTRELYAAGQANHYTISKGGGRKIIHQLPRLRDGVFAGFVEISIVIPDELPHFDRG